MAVKISTLELENVKRIKAVQFEPSPNGLTIIGGKNNQGKTSVIDAIAWALGGNKFMPSNPHRDGSMTNPELKVTLSNGLIVERKGKNSDLKVTDPNGKRSGQTILNAFIEELALNVPKFINLPSKEKANYLLKIIGIGDKLKKMDEEEAELFSKRTWIGQEGRKKAAFAEKLVKYSDIGTQKISASDLIVRQQDILRRNGENAAKRNRVKEYQKEVEDLTRSCDELTTRLKEMQAKKEAAIRDLEIAQTDALDLYDESTAEIEEEIKKIELTNHKIDENIRKQQAEQEAEALRTEYTGLTEQIENIRADRIALLNSAPLPLPELTVEKGEILYKGKQWDGMSGSDQLKVATAIVRKLNPECGFVLLDKLEQMDLETLHEFGEWLEAEGMQAIATRVSTGDECSIIIEDGYIKGQKPEYVEKKKEEWSGNEW